MKWLKIKPVEAEEIAPEIIKAEVDQSNLEEPEEQTEYVLEDWGAPSELRQWNLSTADLRGV